MAFEVLDDPPQDSSSLRRFSHRSAALISTCEIGDKYTTQGGVYITNVEYKGNLSLIILLRVKRYL